MVDFDDTDDDLTEQDRMFRDAGGGGLSSSLGIRRSGGPGRPVRTRSIRTNGRLTSPDGRAWVYVATDQRGRIKIGMTGDPEARAKGLRAVMRLVVEVLPCAAQHVETEALRLLGHKSGDGEWTHATLDTALAAVWVAKAQAAKVMRVDPSLSEDDARRLRMGLANRNFCC